MSDIEIQDYILHSNKCIGKGAFGMIYQGSKKDSKEIYAIKALNKTQIDPLLLYREIQILLELQKESFQAKELVTIYDLYDNKEKDEFYIIMELCQKDLQEEMTQLGNDWYSLQEIKSIMKQIVKGYHILHKNNIIHRDLKPANILISGRDYKIADFGMGKIIQNISQKQCLTKMGTPAYAAPQIFFSDTFSYKADIYSMGVIFYQLLYETLPVQGETTRKFMQNLQQIQTEPIKCPPKNGVSISLRLLIEKMLAYNEADRASFDDLINIEFDNEYFNIFYNQRRQDQITVHENKTVDVYESITVQPGLNPVAGPYKLKQDYHQVKDIQNKTTQLILMLLTKGDAALSIVHYLQMFTVDLKLDQKLQSFIILSIVGYKYVTLLNVQAIILNQTEKQSKQIQKIMESLKEKCNDFINEIKMQLQDVQRLYLEWNNIVIKQKKQDLDKALIPYVNLIQQKHIYEYAYFQKWFNYFMKKYIQPYYESQRKDLLYQKLFYLCKTFQFTENEYPIQKYAWPSEILMSKNITIEEIRIYMEKFK